MERSWGSWRSGTAGGRERSGGSGAAPSCADPGARQGPRCSRSEAPRRTEGAASPELRAHGPRLGLWPLARPATSPASWAHAVVVGAEVRARAAERSSPSPGAGSLCARGAPAAAASSGCCSRRRLPPSSAAARSPPSLPARRLQLKADLAELIPEGH